MRRRGIWLAALGLLAGACGSADDDGSSADGRPSDSPNAGPTGAPNQSDSTTVPPSTLDVVPGKAVVTAGSERFEFTVYDCLIGEETGSPNRRLALSASDTEPFLEARLALNVDILVSQRVAGVEEHVIRITDSRPEGVSLGAADANTPARGGPAPDDWITVDAAARVVRGHGFELREVALDGRTLEEGTLVADCTRPPARLAGD